MNFTGKVLVCNYEMSKDVLTSAFFHSPCV